MPNMTAKDFLSGISQGFNKNKKKKTAADANSLGSKLNKMAKKGRIAKSMESLINKKKKKK